MLSLPSRLVKTARRFRQTATPAPMRAEIRARLAEARAALARGNLDAAQAPADLAHDLSQNCPWLHSRAHGLRLRLHLRHGQAGRALREAPLCLMAGPAALVRRAAGIRPGQPGGRGLLDTWRMRHGES